MIVDVEATRSTRQAEFGAAQTMLDRTEDRFGLKPGYLTADTAYGTAQNLAWLVKHKQITPHIPVFDKSTRTDGTFSRSDFAWEPDADRYSCPAGEELIQFRRNFTTPRTGVDADGMRRYRASQKDCGVCDLKPRCCPIDVRRKIPRRRKKVEMLFAHLKRILGLGRLRLRGPCGAKDEFLLAATAQKLRRLAGDAINGGGVGIGRR